MTWVYFINSSLVHLTVLLYNYVSINRIYYILETYPAEDSVTNLLNYLTTTPNWSGSMPRRQRIFGIRRIAG